MSDLKPILWLPGWYPNRLGPFDGDFIQRHAVAVSELVPVLVLFVKKGSYSMTERVSIEISRQGKLHETVAYYKPFQTGIGMIDRMISFLQYLLLYRRLILEFIRDHGKPQLTHVHVTMRAGLLAFWLEKKFKIPYIITEHWTGFSTRAENNFYQQSILYRWCTRLVLRHASFILPVCHYLEDQLKKLVPEVAFRVIENVVNTDIFFEGEPETESTRFFHASSLHRQKNAEAILRAMATLRNSGRPWQFVVAGPATPELKQLGIELGIDDRIRWLGEISYHAVAAEMRKSSILVMFSRFENLPCVIAEAGCCGLTVISNRVVGIPEMIDETNGVLVDSEPELAAALELILLREQELNRQKIAAEAAARYNYAGIATQIEDVYRVLRT